MLGMTLDIQGPQRTQAEATTVRMAHAIAIIPAHHRKCDSQPQFTAWTAANLSKLDTKLNKLLRRLPGNLSTFFTRLIYLPKTLGGLGLLRLYTYADMRKCSIAMGPHQSYNQSARSWSSGPGSPRKC